MSLRLIHSSVTLPMAKLSPAYAELELLAEVAKKAFHTGPLPLGSTLSDGNDPFPPSHLFCLDQGQPSSVSFAPWRPPPQHPPPKKKPCKTEMENEDAVRR